MRRRTKALAAIGALGMLGAGAWVWSAETPSADAADHNDPPSRVTGTSADREADIADVFAWHTTDGKTVIALTFAGPNDPVAGQAGMYDRDVLYTIHIDTDDDREADHSILARFGVSESGNWGLQLQGVPGADGTQAGAVEYVNRIAGSEGFFWAGLREDPFFFDLEAFQDTLATGTLQFGAVQAPPVPAQDFFAGKNSSAIVIELETADINATDNTFSVWATTARFGG